ncbi:MAG: HAMP domain-containing protein [Candidatus Eisenbacteria bacterium]|nr:HAMP domain-containing protein [Candidatus Eisenbacteria bacterium]
MRFSLRWKILAFAVLPLLALTVPPLWIVNRNVSRQVGRNTNEDLARAAAVFEQMLAARATQLAVDGQVIVRDPKFFAMLTVPREERTAEFDATVAGVARDFNAVTRTDVFDVLDDRGQPLASEGLGSREGGAPAALVRAALSGAPASGVALRGASPFQLTATPVLVSGRVAGVLVVGMRIGQSLAEQLRTLTRSEVTFVFNGIVSGSTLREPADREALRTTLGAAAVSRGSRRATDGPYALQGHGQRYLTLARAIPGSGPSGGQYYALQRSLDAETAFLRRIQGQLELLGLFAVLAALAASLLLSRGILTPIGQIVRGAMEMERGNYEFPIRVRSRDEIRYLADRFLDMRRHQQEHVARLEEVMRIKTDFLSVASHELRTPISVIQGFQELLAGGVLGPLSDPQQEAVRAIGKSTAALTRIAEDATRMSQIEREELVLEPGEHDLSALLREAIAASRAVAPGREVEVSLRAVLAPAPLRVDGPRLVQAVGNLVRNGIRFTPDGGRVEVEAGCAGSGVWIAVRDTGIGIAPGKQREVFERPLSLRDSLQHHSSDTLEFCSAGMGLGLTIARGIVEAHRGSIEVVSAPGQGSTFTVRLPAAVLMEEENAA